MNYYEILGVGPLVTVQQIKEGYRREAMKWHPDRHEGAAAKGEADRRFKDLAVAYRTLRNPTDRGNYDRQLEQNLRQQFEDRQNDQAHQQRAQNEGAQTKQSKQDSPHQDFAHSGSRFEERTASSDDANQMFYEQMLDLAFELDGRGFPEFNIFKALIASGCPESLAKAVAAKVAKQGRGQKDQATPNGQGTAYKKSESNVEFVVKPKRYLAILGAIVGLWTIYECINAWTVPIGGTGWTGNGYLGLPNTVWQYFFQFVAGPFGTWCLIHWGQISIANTLMIIDHRGIRFVRNGGRITKWSEIQKVSFDGKKLKISGIKNGKKWKEQLPKMFVAGNCQEIVSLIDQFSKLGVEQP